MIPAVVDAMAKVEAISGKPVLLEYDRSLTTFAVVKAAKDEDAAHRIICHPDHADLLDHIVVHECGHLIRMFSVPPEKRYVPVTSAEIRQDALSSIEGEISAMEKIYNPVVFKKVKEIWYDGIVKQVTNQPADIRIERWIYENYPELRALQLNSLNEQAKAAVAALTNDVKKATPSSIYEASNAMNYAFYRLIGGSLGVNLVKPYSQHQLYVTRGRQLIEIAESVYGRKDTYIEDIEVSSRWAMNLNISHWFAWYMESEEV